MKPLFRLALLPLAGLVLAGGLNAAPSDKPLTPIAKLLEAPESFDGKPVRTIGFALFPGRNQSYLYSSSEAGERMILSTAVCIEYPPIAWEKIKNFKPGWIEISGRFYATPPGKISTAGTSATISIDDEYAIRPVIPSGETDREKLVASVARLSAMLEIVKAPKALPSEEELEVQLKRSILRLRRYDLTGKVPMTEE